MRVAGESSRYGLLAFISLRRKLLWKANALGKVRLHFPFFNNFTPTN
jgi:hypothetical protein